jgi:radical SAM protein with 4Fe4S-binding SPASM domain
VEGRIERVGWMVGNHCNASCRHCYSSKARRESKGFLSEWEVDRIIQQLVQLGVKAVNLGGNEPIFTHGPDSRKTMLPYIIRRLHEAGMAVGFTTNGVTFRVLDDHYSEELGMVNDIDFSLDSPFAQEHDRTRGMPLYRTVVQGIRRANDLGIGSSVIVCAMRGNFGRESLSAFLSLTKILGCEFRINTLKPIDPALIPEMPSADEFYDGFAFLVKNTRCITLGESCLTAFTGAGSRGCPCGSTSFRINSRADDGSVALSPCVYMQSVMGGDLLSEDVFSILSRPHFEAFVRRRQDFPKACRESDCPYLETCRGGCAARTYFVTGTMDARDPYCPLEYVQRHGRAPDLPSGLPIGCDGGVRVHEDYLCTWIGKVNATFHDPRFTSLEEFYRPALAVSS